MALEYAILGFLNYQPLTGYDLKKVFDRSIRHFWHADQSQIYRTLSRLTEDGAVKMEIVEQTDRPDRKVYSITPAGRERLLNWLKQPFPDEDSRSKPLVQMFFSGQISDERILEKLTEALEGMRRQMAMFDLVPDQVREFTSMAKDDRELFYWFLTLELGKRSLQTNIDWLESVVDRIRRQDYSTEIGFKNEFDSE
ncbi:MAG: PadR family transcriptional regulator [Chloroflexi bacterium]|nr:PadR family transcriptional regulator [Chloroflexota bacterium]